MVRHGQSQAPLSPCTGSDLVAGRSTGVTLASDDATLAATRLTEGSKRGLVTVTDTHGAGRDRATRSASEIAQREGT